MPIGVLIKMEPTYLDLDAYQNNMNPPPNGNQLTPPWSNVSDANSRSPCSTTSDTSYTSLQNLNLYSMSDIRPKLVITQQPVDKFRFRYKSEMHGTHGSLMGSRTEKSKKTFPTVELKNFNGTAMIRCSLYQTDTNKLSSSQHSHRLVVRSGDTDKNDPHHVIVSPTDGYIAVFQGMGIIHTAKKNIIQELINKKREEALFEKGSELTERESARIRQTAENEAKSMNLNQVCLCFQAYYQDVNMMWKPLCEKVCSNPINNMKSALTGELKITRLSAATSCASGGMDLFLFVEKVGKKNIKVRFFELDENDELYWEDWGHFTEADVHHQYGIALQTPPYKNKDIEKHVDVFIQLVRPSDNDRSEPMHFKYKPRTYMDSRKRRRTDSTFNSAEIPTVLQNIGFRQQGNDYGQGTTISEEYNASGLINAIMSEDLFRAQVEHNSDELMQYIDCDLNASGLDNSLNQSILGNTSTLETDGGGGGRIATPTSVIKSGPNAPPIGNSTNETIVKKIMAITRTYRDDPNKIKFLITDVLKRFDQDGDNILHSAIRDGESNTVQPLLKIINQFDLGSVLQLGNIRQETCLHVACRYDKPEYIRPLINLGADPNLPDIAGNTPLHIAVELGYLMCASRILDKQNYTTKSIQLNINLANDDGQTAIHRAVKLKNFGMTQKLLEMGQASVKVAETKTGNNILHIGVQENDVDIVKYILEKTTIDVNAENNSGYSALLLACSSSVPEATSIVKLLLEHNADLKQTQHQHSQIRRTLTKDEEDDEEDDIQKPKCSFEMARHNPVILALLKDSAGLKQIKTEVMDVDNEPISGDQVIIFDDECFDKLCVLLNKRDCWKKLAGILKCSSFVTDIKSNPTQTLLNIIEMQRMNIEEVIQLFESINEDKAILIVNEMIARKSIKA